MRGDEAEPAELILLGGKIRTMDEGNPLARAVAVGGGRFLAVGEEEQVLHFKGDATVVEKLSGGAACLGTKLMSRPMLKVTRFSVRLPK